MLADSHPLGAILYRKWHMYDMMWGNDKQLENYTVCGASYGGPVAMLPDHKKINQGDAKEGLCIFSSSGHLLSKTDWVDGNLVSMGWTDHEHLVTLNEHGNHGRLLVHPLFAALTLHRFPFVGVVRLYDVLGKQLKQFTLVLEGLSSTTFLECHFWGNGLAAMSSEYVIHVAEVTDNEQCFVSFVELSALTCGAGLRSPRPFNPRPAVVHPTHRAGHRALLHLYGAHPTAAHAQPAVGGVVGHVGQQHARCVRSGH
jgi:hypothetical protein